MAARELSNVKVSKLSLVFRPANGDAIRITKSAAAQFERSADRKALTTKVLKQAASNTPAPVRVARRLNEASDQLFSSIRKKDHRA